MYIEVKNLSSWKDYVELHSNLDLTPYIFRGQSNSINERGEFTTWKLQSSFNRVYTKKFSLQFTNVLNQHLQDQLFNSNYSGYSYSNICDLTSLSALQKCFYLQHHGIPTCLIDFTTDPLIAMYFAMSSIQGASGSSYDGDGNCTHFSNDVGKDYVSIYRINWRILKEHFSIKEITVDNFDSYLSTYSIHYHRSELVNVKLGLILQTGHDTEIDKNFNLVAQKGCFILFDNENGPDLDCRGNGKVDFVRFLESHETYRTLTLPEPVVTIFNIKYNSFMNSMNRFNPDNSENISAFEFLKRKNLTGRHLFNDIQGLKYDFNFFHSR